jgi:hypothetical protein
MIRHILIVAIILFSLSAVCGQELNCTVDIEYSKTQSTDPKVFETLKGSILEFMNSRKWTDDTYEEFEKIDCSILINIDEEYSANEFGGQIIINSVRPVFNSSYKSVVFSYKDDDFRFEYNEYDNLEFSENNYFSNLTSMLGFYAYMVIGFDYDSFSPEGGTPYYLKAQDVITSIPAGQRARYPGWDPFDGNRNRAILMGHLTNPRYSKFREAIYQWHFEGLDKMYDDAEKGRKTISGSLDLVKEVYDDNPNTPLIKILFLAKSEEIVSIYSAAGNSEKNDIIELVSNMDPVNTNKYMEIR